MVQKPEIRSIRLARPSTPTLEGAGVKLKRAFGNSDARDLDPFLLLDDFRSSDPRDFMAGFPWHPHRGIETITYVLDGGVEHQDSIGNAGTLGPGDVQWMTAGSGILHQEMISNSPAVAGFQLWANLPSGSKMIDPRYQELTDDQIPTADVRGSHVRVIAGSVGDVVGPVSEIVIDPEYLDVTVPPDSEFTHRTHRDHTVAAYVFEGRGNFTGRDVADARSHNADDGFGNGTLIVFERGDAVRVRTSASGVRFILFSGRPLGEPIAWAGPIVMNSRAELAEAFDELDRGSFVKVSERAP